MIVFLLNFFLLKNFKYIFMFMVLNHQLYKIAFNEYSSPFLYLFPYPQALILQWYKVLLF